MFATKIRAAALAGASALMLSGCLFTPGTFTSELQLMKDGSFAYSYDGEIQMLALSKLAEMGAEGDDAFEAAACVDDESFEDRECTAAEVAAQRAEWEAAAEERAARRAKDAAEMKAFLGGIDPSNPEAAKELAANLQRQRGWEKVDYLGDGLFDVDFRVSGQLSHDFVFPIVEKLPMGNAFVSVVLRDGAQVRVDAPGFAARGGNPMQVMGGGMAGLLQLAAKENGGTDGDAPRMVTPDGTFIIVTDGRILANNTDKGPQASARGQVLGWTISQRTEQAPTALIAFD